MRKISFAPALAMLAACLLVGEIPANAQGDLAPPGPPAPVMKTLQQVEPRTPISSLPHTIDAPGSYYVTTNLTGAATLPGISIESDDVTLDLNGFTLTGVLGAEQGIAVPLTQVNITIRNGTVRGWPLSGVGAGNADQSRLIDLNATTNGWAFPSHDGLRIGENSLVQSCAAADNRETGIDTSTSCSVVDCTANNNGTTGFEIGNGSVVARCTALNNVDIGIDGGNSVNIKECSARENGASGFFGNVGSSFIACVAFGNASNGISAVAFGCTVRGCTTRGNGNDGIATRGASVTECTSTSNDGDGIDADFGSLVSRCMTEFNAGDGIRVTQDSRVLDNHCDSNGLLGGDGAGIHATGSDNRIEGNSTSDGDRGIEVSGAGNLILRNSAAGNTTNYVIAVNNKVGVIVNAPNSAAISGSTGGAGVGTTDPWANFSF